MFPVVTFNNIFVPIEADGQPFPFYFSSLLGTLGEND